ncbi:MAG: AbrB/MazE/SpoVT family DNA-binding domain-containing protein [Burkholderiales bacterium]|nr:AbrB/MazE/SpoVT family DNA-binding domain-containing protein [Burkholderiales bacterium]
MKLKIRKVGNSLGVLIPREVLRDWGLGEGDDLHLYGRAFGPPRASRNAQAVQDELKRSIAVAVLDQFPLERIRIKSRENLLRWKRSGVWGGAYEEWLRLVEHGTDGELYGAMMGRDDHANRLRQSPPFVGMLRPEVVEALREKAAA